MKTYIAYKNQIRGFEDVSQTVKVIEQIAASSVHALRQEVANFNRYEEEVKKALLRLSSFYTDKNNALLKKGTGGKALVIFTGEKGLVGGLWHAIINTFLSRAGAYEYVITIGEKGKNYLKEEHTNIVKSFSIAPDNAKTEDVLPIAHYLFNEFRRGTYATIDILYPKFVSLADQQPTIIPFLPFTFIPVETGNPPEGLPIFESSKKDIFDRLLQKYIRMFFYNIAREAKLSELAARTIAMEHASSQTDAFVKKFTFDFIKERHRETTQKQLESFVVHTII